MEPSPHAVTPLNSLDDTDVVSENQATNVSTPGSLALIWARIQPSGGTIG